jgi:hypothetical protein
MSSQRRLQILVSQPLERRVKKAAQRSRLSTGAWVRRAIEHELAGERAAADPLQQLSSLGAPTSDLAQMLADIEAGRG